MSKTVVLSAPPYQVPPVGSNGLLTDAWQKWVEQLFLRVGGIAALSNVGLTNVESTGRLTAKSIQDLTETIYASPTGLSTVIDSLSVTNGDYAARTISIYLVPFGASAGSTNQLVSNISLLPGVTTIISSAVGQVLGSGATIVVNVDKANVVSVSASGRQVS